MLAYLLALVVGLGSLAIFCAGFFIQAIYRKGDFIWSGVGLFYALVLWACAGRITGGVLLGQVASVALLSWLGWQAFQFRWENLPPEQQSLVTNLSAEQEGPTQPAGLTEKAVRFVTGLFGQNKTDDQSKADSQPVTEAETPAETIAEAPTTATIEPESSISLEDDSEGLESESETASEPDIDLSSADRTVPETIAAAARVEPEAEAKPEGSIEPEADAEPEVNTALEADAIAPVKTSPTTTPTTTPDPEATSAPESDLPIPDTAAIPKKQPTLAEKVTSQFTSLVDWSQQTWSAIAQRFNLAKPSPKSILEETPNQNTHAYPDIETKSAAITSSSTVTKEAAPVPVDDTLQPPSPEDFPIEPTATKNEEIDEEKTDEGDEIEEDDTEENKISDEHEISKNETDEEKTDEGDVVALESEDKNNTSATEPETIEPETLEPETLEPETGEPAAIEPETLEPETIAAPATSPETTATNDEVSAAANPPTSQEQPTETTPETEAPEAEPVEPSPQMDDSNPETVDSETETIEPEADRAEPDTDTAEAAPETNTIDADKPTANAATPEPKTESDPLSAIKASSEETAEES